MYSELTYSLFIISYNFNLSSEYIAYVLRRMPYLKQYDWMTHKRGSWWINWDKSYRVRRKTSYDGQTIFLNGGVHEIAKKFLFFYVELYDVFI